jgi:hypothetical protein
MRVHFVTALAACAALWPAVAVADTVSLQVTDPKDGFKSEFAASWRQTPTTATRYWLCDRPLWVASGVGPKISRLYQGGAHIEVVAIEGDAGTKHVICTLADPARPADAKAAAGKGDGRPPAK